MNQEAKSQGAMNRAATPKGVHGNTGGHDGHEALRALAALGATGTLVLERAGGAALILLEQGQPQARHALGPAPDLGHAQLRFHFESHASAATPRLSSRFPQSVVPALRAVPDLAFVRLPPLSDLQAVLSQQARARLTGGLLVGAQPAQGLLLLVEGELAAAVCEEDGHVRQGTEALRALRRAHVSHSEAALWLRDWPRPLALSLVGFLHANKTAQTSNFSGLEAGEEGYSYVQDGQRALTVSADLRGQGARYAPLPTLPRLQLPDEPPGWEQRRYQLTLRGRDALNPMTDVAFTFQKAHGRTGRKVLEQLGRGLTLEAVAQLLSVELGELKPWVEALEKEGLTRADP